MEENIDNYFTNNRFLNFFFCILHISKILKTLKIILMTILTLKIQKLHKSKTINKR